MLDELDGVDWRSVEHAYGPATDVPDMIRALRSPDVEVRDEALSELFSTIWHQGTVYSASAPAAPFLISLAADPATPDRLGILLLLQALATGASYIDAHEPLGRDDLARLCEEQGSDLERERARERADVAAAHAAVAAGVPVYDTLLTDPDPQVRGYTLHLLASLREHAAALVPRLRSLLAEETDPAVRLGLTRALHALADAGRHACAVFSDIMARDADPVTRLIAAVALVARQKDGAPPQAFDLLMAAAREAQTDRTWFDQPHDERWSIARGYLPSPWGESLIGLISAALEGLEPVRRMELFAQALSRAAAPDAAHALAATLLEHAFGARDDAWASVCWGRGPGGRQRIRYHMRASVPPRTAQDLSALQRAGVAALIQSDVFWQIETNLLECYGMPGARGDLERWLEPHDR